MKNLANILKNPYFQKIVLCSAICGFCIAQAAKYGHKEGLENGAKIMSDALERMTPGAAEQLEKFMAAEHFGWGK